MSKISIEGKDYLIESLPDQAKNILQLIQMNNQKLSDANLALALGQAASQKLSQDLIDVVKKSKVKPIPTPKIEGSETAKPAPANRRSRRSASSTKSKKS